MDRRKEEYRGAFEQYIADIMAQYEAVGLAVSAFDTNSVLYQNFWGYRNADIKTTIDEDTIFGMASISKSFTSLSVLQLAKRGIINIQTPVSEYIPEFHDSRPEQVRVWHLMCHSGGFFPMRRILVEEVARDLGIWNNGREELTFHEGLAQEGAARVAQRMNEQTRFLGLPGERMSYCNDGYALLSEIVRRYGGESSFAEYVRKNILLPLGMTRSSCEYIAPLADANAVTLYRHRKDVLCHDFDYYDNAFVLPGGGAMKSTVNDMRAYVRMYMAKGNPVADDYIVREMTKPRQEYRFQQYYGYGIATHCMNDLVIHQHGGSLTGVSSNFAWSPQLGIGVVVLCNTSGVPVASISNALIRWFDGLDPVDHDHWHDVEWGEQTLRNVCGIYHSGEGVHVEITMRANMPAVSTGGQDVPFRLVAPDMLIVTNPMKDGDMIFLSDDDGRIWGIRYGGRIIPKAD